MPSSAWNDHSPMPNQASPASNVAFEDTVQHLASMKYWDNTSANIKIDFQGTLTKGILMENNERFTYRRNYFEVRCRVFIHCFGPNQHMVYVSEGGEQLRVSALRMAVDGVNTESNETVGVIKMTAKRDKSLAENPESDFVMTNLTFFDSESQSQTATNEVTLERLQFMTATPTTARNGKRRGISRRAPHCGPKSRRMGLETSGCKFAP